MNTAALLALLALQDAGAALSDALARLAEGRKVSRAEVKSVLRAADTPAARSLYFVVVRLDARYGTMDPADSAVLREYVKRFRNPGPPDDAAAFQFLAGEIAKSKEPRRLWISRAFVLAHLESVRQSPKAALAALNLVEAPEGPLAAEGRIVEEVRETFGQVPFAEIEKLLELEAVSSDPGLKVFRALCMLAGAFQPADPKVACEAFQKAARALAAAPLEGSSHKPALDAIRTRLEGLKFCKRCGGTHELRCDFLGCAEGKVVKRCVMCNGTGKNPQSYSEPNRQSPCPAKVPGGSHTWTDSCTRCGGSGKLPCKACKGPLQIPAVEEVYELVPCETCSQTGFLLQNVRLPCPDCFGFGSAVALPKPKPKTAPPEPPPSEPPSKKD
jgi:hypothetical protein